MHLIRRFLGFLFARPLTPKEQHQVRGLLDSALARAFFAQRPQDQRHAFTVLQRVGASRELAEAALLHVGALAALERSGSKSSVGEAALCGALAHLDLGGAAEAGAWLDLATRLLGADEPAVLSARAEWHLARWEGAEASALLA